MKVKNSLIGSIAALRCPHCRKASLFVQPTTYKLEKLGVMYSHCPVCNTNLKPEPGFYFGAAYAAWGMIVVLWLLVLIILKILNAIGVIEFGFLTHPVTFLSTGLAVNLVLFPYIFRLSRSAWAHFFIK